MLRPGRAGPDAPAILPLDGKYERPAPLPDEPITGLRDEGRRDRETLQQLLADIRDLVGAEEAIFWRWDAEGNRLFPAVWCTGNGARPRHFRTEDWSPLVQWTTEERVVHCDGHDDRPVIATAPVLAGEELLGALSVSNEGGLRLDRAMAKRWLPRHATNLATLVELLATRERFGRELRGGGRLMEAVKAIRGEAELRGFAVKLCEQARLLAGGDFAALVRWRASAGAGEVAGVTSGLALHRVESVPADSLVGQVCVRGQPLITKDGRALRQLLGSRDNFDGCGSLAIVPLEYGEVLGAIVVAYDRLGAASEESVARLSALGTIAAGSLRQFEAMDRMASESRTDPLTGLANRKEFDEELAIALEKADRYSGAVSLIMIDIDHFKRVNDGYGHEAGDEVLRQAARLIADTVRTVDVCARYGGEEIAIILPQTEQPGAIELAERLRCTLESRPVGHGGQAIRVTASFGVACFPDVVRDRSELVAAADAALYEAKRGGRNQVRAAAVNGSRAKH